MEQRYLNEYEVSKVTGLALSTLRNDRSGDRKLFPYTKIGRSVRYKEADILEAMESRKIQTRTPGR